MSQRLIPRLVKTHPAFAIVYTSTALFHFAFAYSNMWDRARFASRSFNEVYEFADYPIWAVAHLVVGLLLAYGIYGRNHWNVARVGFLCGFFACFMRGWLLEESPNPGAGWMVWILFFGGCHLAQMYDRRPPTY